MGMRGSRANMVCVVVVVVDGAHVAGGERGGWGSNSVWKKRSKKAVDEKGNA